MYIDTTLQPTRLLTSLLKKPHLHFCSMHSPPKIIRVVFAYTFFYAIEKVVLYHQLTKPEIVSLSRPALLKHFKGTANHAGHIWSQQPLVPSISVPRLGLDISKRRVATLLHATVKKYKVEGGTSQVCS